VLVVGSGLLAALVEGWSAADQVVTTGHRSALSPSGPDGDRAGTVTPVPSSTVSRGSTWSDPRRSAAAPLPPGLTAADLEAGVLSAKVPWRAKGRLRTVAGDRAAPKGSGRVHRVVVRVEAGLSVDGRRFADFVLDTLNDRRSWGRGGAVRFARTDSRSAADLTVVLASPELSARLCRPLRTFGKLSCRTGSSVVFTHYRWVKGITDYGTDRTGYRHYLVNHEVGHWLGNGHRSCPGRGRRAPVMMQQTKGLRGCRPNPWPHP